MDFLDPQLEAYAEEYSSPESDVLARLNRETHMKVLYPRMLSGHLQGRVLSMLSRLHKPRRIVEVGTYTGYSAICLAEGLQEDGEIITLEIDPEREDFARPFFREAGIADKVRFMIGHAADLIPKIEGPVDMAFLDADKENYGLYYDLIFPKIPVGGVILADNMLWSGKVIDESAQDKETQSLRAFVQKVAADSRVEQVLMPIRDGIMVIIKNEE